MSKQDAENSMQESQQDVNMQDDPSSNSSQPEISNDIDLILVGVPGSGKSATGNSVLGHEVFKRNMTTTSQTLSCKLLKESCSYMEKTISVVDGLRIGEIGNDGERHVDNDADSLKQAVELCRDGFSALLIVLDFGSGFHQEDIHMLKVVKSILGMNVIKDHGICVITHKDNYERVLEDEEIRSFDDWCKQQGAEMESFIEECNHRYVLLENRTKQESEKEKQREELVRCVLKLSDQGRRKYAKMVKSNTGDSLKMRISQFGLDIMEKLQKMQRLIMIITTLTEASDFETLLKELDDLIEEVSQMERWIPQIQALHREISATVKANIDPYREDLHSRAVYNSNGMEQANEHCQREEPLMTDELLKENSESKHAHESMDISSDNGSQQLFQHALDGEMPQPDKSASEPQGHKAFLADGQLSDRNKRGPAGMKCNPNEDSATGEKVTSMKARIQEVEDSFQKSKAEYKSKLQSLLTELQDQKQIICKLGTADLVVGLLGEVEANECFLQSKLSSWGEHTCGGQEPSQKGIKLCQPTSKPGSDVKTIEFGSDHGGDNVSPLIEKGKTSQSRPDSIDLLLTGRTGNGRSATGNAITGKRTFKINVSTTSETEMPTSSESIAHATIDDQKIRVIDGPGIKASESTEDVGAMIASLEKSLKLCEYSFSALLIVLKFGERFTKQENEAMKAIRKILGSDVIKEYGICVVTYGDNFESAVEEAEENGVPMTFESWCKAQTGDAKKLFEECNFRCVLFNNITKDAAQRQAQFQKLMSFVNVNARYSEEKYLMAEKGKQELLFESRLPQLKQQTEDIVDSIQERMGKIGTDGTGSLEDLRKQKETMGHFLDELNAHKDSLQESGHNSPSVGQLVLMITVVEEEIVSKVKRICIEEKVAIDAAQSESTITHRPVPEEQIEEVADGVGAAVQYFEGWKERILDAFNNITELS